VLSGNLLCHNPRVMKEAEALRRHGFELAKLGGASPKNPSKIDNFFLFGWVKEPASFG